jgi:hypothetical protein
MATNDEQVMRWLAGELAWERTFSKLRGASAGTDDGPREARPEPVDEVRALDHKRAMRARRRAASCDAPLVADRDPEEHPGRVAVDGGLPTSA